MFSRSGGRRRIVRRSGSGSGSGRFRSSGGRGRGIIGGGIRGGSGSSLRSRRGIVGRSGSSSSSSRCFRSGRRRRIVGGSIRRCAGYFGRFLLCRSRGGRRVVRRSGSGSSLRSRRGIIGRSGSGSLSSRRGIVGRSSSSGSSLRSRRRIVGRSRRGIVRRSGRFCGSGRDRGFSGSNSSSFGRSSSRCRSGFSSSCRLLWIIGNRGNSPALEKLKNKKKNSEKQKAIKKIKEGARNDE